MLTYLAIVGLYLLAIGYNRMLAVQPAESYGKYGCLLAVFGFGFTALLATGGLLGCPVGGLTSSWSNWGQFLGVVGGLMALPSFLQKK